MKPFILFGLSAILAVSCASQPSATSTPAASPEASPEATASPVTPATPTPVAQAETNGILRTGMFVDGEHPTQGEVRVVSEGGQTFLEFGDNFQTDNGPDLVVVLHRASDIIGSSTPPAFPISEGDYVVLEPLQNVQGAQRYAIPANVNLADYQSAAIWCRQFNATFGAAALQG